MRFRVRGAWTITACLVLAACGSAASEPAPVATPTPSAASLAPSPTPSPAATPFPSLPPTSTPTQLAESRWWRLGFGAERDWATLEVGTGDATVTGSLRIGDPQGFEGLGPAFAHGPFAGRVVAASANAGGPTDLTIIDVPTGTSMVAVSAPDILDATLDPTGTVVYWVSAGGDQDGVSRLSLVDGRSEQLLAFPFEPAAAARGIVPAAYVELTGQVVMSADGTRLAAMRCRQDGCDLGVLDLARAQVEWYRIGEPWQSLLGFAGKGVSLLSRCVSLPTGDLVDHCGALDERAQGAELARNMGGGGELPTGWHLEIQPVPGAPPMSFQVEVVAVPDAGGDPVLFPALEALGQG